ncbi:MAG TPA: YciI family protein [Mucilaginibacter sp.]|nr:YciI family protein [Mucilaginibacter sp.]
MPHYFLKLIPRRPTFSQDMTPEERAIMMQHIAYWTELMNKGKVAVFGPVADPAGVYGMGVVEAENEEELADFMNNDPAVSINRYEHYLMLRAVMPSK